MAEVMVYAGKGDEVIVVAVPPDNDVSDLEDIEDDSTGPAEGPDVLRFLDVQCSGDTVENDDEDAPERVEQSSEEISAPAKRRREETSAPQWQHAGPVYRKWTGGADLNVDILRGIHERLHGATPLQIFEQLLTEEIYRHIRVETLRYAADVKNDRLFTLEDSELKAFFGFLLLSGYVSLPNERLYWSDDEDIGQPLVKKAITRNKYLKIKEYMHFVDNSKSAESADRGFKIRPLIDLLNATFKKFGIYQKRLAVDEMIVRYYGSSALKHSTRSKPNRFGFKLWAMCGEDGYCHKFDLHCGKELRSQDQPLGTRVIMDMISEVSEPTRHELYFDSVFTSRALLAQLRDLGFRATGTVRENRMDKCPMESVKTFLRKKRGVYDSRFDTTEEVLAVQWNDSKMVRVMTNFDRVTPVSHVKRYVKAAGKDIDVSQPGVIKNYHSGMGGVIFHDWLLGKHSISIRGKKWYWYLITRMVDMAVVNGWVLHRAVTPPGEQMTLLEFRRDITRAYLRSAAAQRPGPPPRRSAAVSSAISLRYDGVGHLLVTTGFRRRCLLEGCASKPSKGCGKCGVPLCAKCFAEYHLR